MWAQEANGQDKRRAPGESKQMCALGKKVGEGLGSQENIQLSQCVLSGLWSLLVGQKEGGGSSVSVAGPEVSCSGSGPGAQTQPRRRCYLSFDQNSVSGVNRPEALLLRLFDADRTSLSYRLGE